VSGALGSPANNVRLIGQSVFTTYLLAFEVTSALLVVAVVGAVVLARRPRRAREDTVPEGDATDGDEVTGGGPEAGPDEVTVDAGPAQGEEPDATGAELAGSEVTGP
jgi:NADH-quinone oxidoreductase subunit J